MELTVDRITEASAGLGSVPYLSKLLPFALTLTMEGKDEISDTDSGIILQSGK